MNVYMHTIYLSCIYAYIFIQFKWRYIIWGDNVLHQSHRLSNKNSNAGMGNLHSSCCSEEAPPKTIYATAIASGCLPDTKGKKMSHVSDTGLREIEQNWGGSLLLEHQLSSYWMEPCKLPREKSNQEPYPAVAYKQHQWPGWKTILTGSIKALYPRGQSSSHLIRLEAYSTWRNLCLTV